MPVDPFIYNPSPSAYSVLLNVIVLGTSPTVPLRDALFFCSSSLLVHSSSSMAFHFHSSVLTLLVLDIKQFTRDLSVCFAFTSLQDSFMLALSQLVRTRLSVSKSLFFQFYVQYLIFSLHSVYIVLCHSKFSVKSVQL